MFYLKFNRLKNLSVVLLVLLACLLLSGCGFHPKADVPSHINSQLENIWNFTVGAARLTGVVFIFRAVYQLKVYGDLRTMMSVQTNFKSTMMLFFVGTMLFGFGRTISTMLMTIFAISKPIPLGYSGSEIFSVTGSQTVLHFVQVIGIISFLRGWVQLAQTSNPNGRNTFGKALTHIVAGILAVNIEGTRQLLAATF